MHTEFSKFTDDELAQRRIDLEFRLALSLGKANPQDLNELRAVMTELGKRAKASLMQTTGNAAQEDTYNSVVAATPKSY